MFDDIPDNYTSQTADNEEEGWRYTQGDKNARRPPELLTRDHVARCIVREVSEGRGSPHGGVFLDIAWIKETLPNAAEHIKKKLPSMYHQFKQLADIDITKEPMEVGPTTHYVMGGVRVDARHARCRRCPGLFAAGECAAGLHGANRLGGNSLSDLLVFGKRAGEYAAQVRQGERAPATVDDGAGRRGGAPGAGAVRARRRRPRARTRSSTSCRTMMQDLVGIVRTRGARCSRRSTALGELQAARRARSASTATASTTPAGTPRSTCTTC